MIYILTTDPFPIIGDKVYILGGIATISHVWKNQTCCWLKCEERELWVYTWEFLQSMQELYKKKYFNIKLVKDGT